MRGGGRPGDGCSSEVENSRPAAGKPSSPSEPRPPEFCRSTMLGRDFVLEFRRLRAVWPQDSLRGCPWIGDRHCP